MADYYEVLGIDPERDRRRDQARVPGDGAPVPPRQQPRRPRRRGEVQGGQRRLRDAARSRAPSSLRRVRRRAAPVRAAGPGGAPARRSVSATSSTRSSAATRSATGAARPARRRAPTPRRSSTSTSRRPRSAPPRPSTSACPSSCERCEGSGCEPGTHPARCDVCGGAGEVREVRRSILGQIVTAAPCVACSATGSRIPTPCRECRGDGRVAGVAVHRRRGPGRRRRRPAAPPLGSRPGRAARRRARRPLRHRAGRAPTRASNARATTSSTCAAIAFTQAALGHAPRRSTRSRVSRS